MAIYWVNRAEQTRNRAWKALRYRWILLIFFVPWLLGPKAALLSGQTYLQSVGSPTFSTKIPIENGYIDASNGRLHLNIPLGSYAQRGSLGGNIALAYDSNIWTYAGTTAWTAANATGSYPFSYPTAGGWRITTPRDGTSNYTYTPVGKCGSYGQEGADKYWNWTYTSPDGTVHPFSAWTQAKIGCTYTDIPTASGWATDASGYFIYITSYTNSTIYAPDGTMVVGTGGYGNGTVEDSNGNQYLGYSSITDTLGRTLITTSSLGSTYTYKVQNAQGSTSSYIVTTASITAKTNFGQSGVTECTSGACATLTVVRSIQLPDGSEYIFKYDCDSTIDSTDCSSPSGQSAYYGLLTSMTLPTGGAIAYSWNLFTDSQGNHYVWIKRRVTPDSSTGWTYSQAVVTTCSAGQVNCQQTFTMVKPNNDQNVFTFTLNGGAWASQIQYYNGTSTVLATTSQCWKYVATVLSNGTCPISAPATGTPATQVLKVISSTNLPTPSGSVTKSTQYTPDSYGNYTLIQENNFYSGSLPSTVDRTTTISYLGGTSYINAVILNRPASVTITNSGGGTVAQTLYCYDYAAGCGGSSFASITGVVNHDDTKFGTTNAIRGDPTQTKRLVSGTTNYLSTSMTYDMTGRVLTSTDSDGNVTTYNYANSFFDDNGANPSAPHSASSANAFPTTVTPAISSLASTFGYYYGTGQLAKATDPNGNTTYSHYADPFNRPTATALPNGGWTLRQYDTSGATPPLQIAVERYTGIASASGTGCSNCRHDETLLDSAGLGRPAKQLLVNDPDGQTEVDTTFDSNGRVATISNPYRSGADPTYGLETPTYDGLDRPWKVTHADGNNAYTYYGTQITGTLGQTTQQCSATTYGMGYPVLVIDESGKKRETWTDGFGRLIEADEPNSSGSLSVYTCYSYDLNNNLTGVSSSAVSPNQTRTFTYDMVSRITSKTEPETGTTCFYYTTSGGTCGSPASGTLCSGDPTAVCRRTDPRSITTTYSYDAMNRLTRKDYSDGTPSLVNFYDFSLSSLWGFNNTNYMGRLSLTCSCAGSTWIAGSRVQF